MNTKPKPVTRTIPITFFLSQAEMDTMKGLQQERGVDASNLVRLAIRIMDERNIRAEPVDSQQVRCVTTTIRFAKEDKAILARIVKRDKCKQSEVIRFALHELHTRGLQFG